MNTVINMDMKDRILQEIDTIHELADRHYPSKCHRSERGSAFAMSFWGPLVHDLFDDEIEGYDYAGYVLKRVERCKMFLASTSDQRVLNRLLKVSELLRSIESTSKLHEVYIESLSATIKKSFAGGSPVRLGWNLRPAENLEDAYGKELTTIAHELKRYLRKAMSQKKISQLCGGPIKLRGIETICTETNCGDEL